jgi:hypothetical protein
VRRRERIEARVREVVHGSHLFDARAVDLLDLAHEEIDRHRLPQHHRELVDRDVLTALEHVDADDVAVDRADARGDESERARPVGEPHPNQDVGSSVVRVAHPDDGTGTDDANVSPR